MAQGWPLSRRGRVGSLPGPGTWGTLSLPANPPASGPKHCRLSSQLRPNADVSRGAPRGKLTPLCPWTKSDTAVEGCGSLFPALSCSLCWRPAEPKWVAGSHCHDPT